MIDSLKRSIGEARRQISYLEERIKKQERLMDLLSLNPEIAKAFSELAGHVLEQYGIEAMPESETPKESLQ